LRYGAATAGESSGNNELCACSPADVFVFLPLPFRSQVSAGQQELLQLRDDAAAASRERRQLQEQISTLQRQRGQQGGAMQELQQQLASLQEQLTQDRATLATMLRTHQEREQQLQEVGLRIAEAGSVKSYLQMGDILLAWKHPRQ
jgi:septal ring factor EnvC (AmiA/AmiB activator)